MAEHLVIEFADALVTDEAELAEIERFWAEVRPDPAEVAAELERLRLEAVADLHSLERLELALNVHRTELDVDRGDG
jgi:hypothetical protein